VRHRVALSSRCGSVRRHSASRRSWTRTSASRSHDGDGRRRPPRSRRESL
ncbi:MAG: hypothetical protein AVDCRST_MAG66-838, partial [uncultured Pseudonocardia sp.]